MADHVVAAAFSMAGPPGGGQPAAAGPAGGNLEVTLDLPSLDIGKLRRKRASAASAASTMTPNQDDATADAATASPIHTGLSDSDDDAPVQKKPKLSTVAFDVD